MISEAVTVTYTAWDTDAAEPKTGDAANHTIRYIADGVADSPAALPTEVELGEYSIVLAADENDGAMMAVVGSSSTANVEIIKASWQNVRNIGLVTVASAVSVDGTALEIVRGDDYKIADSRAVEFSSTSWPDLTDAAVKLTIRLKKGKEVELEVAGTIVDADTCRFELTHTLTNGMTPSSQGHLFDVEAILSNGNYITLVLGDCTVLEDVTR